MSLDEEMAKLGNRISTDALCVRFEVEQDKAIRELAKKYGVSNAVIVRTLVARGLRTVS